MAQDHRPGPVPPVNTRRYRELFGRKRLIHPRSGTPSTSLDFAPRSSWLPGEAHPARLYNCFYSLMPFKLTWGTSLAVQWLRLHASTAGGMGSIPGLGSDPVCHVVQTKKKKRERKKNEYYPFLIILFLSISTNGNVFTKCQHNLFLVGKIWVPRLLLFVLTLPVFKKISIYHFL